MKLDRAVLVACAFGLTCLASTVSLLAAEEAKDPLKVSPWGKNGTGTICRNGPEGASHKLELSPFLDIHSKPDSW